MPVRSIWREQVAAPRHLLWSPLSILWPDLARRPARTSRPVSSAQPAQPPFMRWQTSVNWWKMSNINGEDYEQLYVLLGIQTALQWRVVNVTGEVMFTSYSPVSSHHQWGRSSSSHSHPSSAQWDSWQSVWHCVTGRGMTWRVTRDTWQPRHGPELGDDDLGAAPLPGRQLQVGHHRDIR